MSVGPVAYWFEVHGGRVDPAAIHPMAGHLPYFYAACVAVVLAHAVAPNPRTRKLAAFGFGAWYAWATFVINGHEY